MSARLSAGRPIIDRGFTSYGCALQTVLRRTASGTPPSYFFQRPEISAPYVPHRTQLMYDVLRYGSRREDAEARFN